MTHHNRSRFFQVERKGAKSQYIYTTLAIDRVFNLYKNYSWLITLKMQASSTKLLPSEEFSIGGYLTVRGYEENTIVGDNGVLIKNELRTPEFNIFRKNVDNWQLLVFVDYGNTWEVDPNIQERKGSSLTSIGPGVRLTIHKYLSCRFDYGFQLERAYVDHSRSSRAHVGVVLSY